MTSLNKCRGATDGWGVGGGGGYKERVCVWKGWGRGGGVTW